MLHYKVHQNKEKRPWLIFLHGAGGSNAVWRPQWEAMKTHFNLLAPDLRDHGKSKMNVVPGDSYTFELVTQDIFEVIDHLGIHQAHFITLSFGSVLMQYMAMKRPELIDRVVLAGGIFKATWAIRTFVHAARLLNNIFSYPQMYRIFSFLLMPKKAHQRSRRIYQIQSQKLSRQEYLNWLGLYGEFFNTLENFFHHTILRQGLVVMGEHDYVFLSGAQRFVKKHDNMQIRIIDGAGHICALDAPNEFNRILMQFLTADNAQSKKMKRTIFAS